MRTVYSVESPETTEPRADLVAQLLRFALDPAACIGEAENAARRMITIARRERLGFPDLERFIAANHKPALPAPEPAPEPPAAMDIVLTFGKYRHHTLGNIGENDLSYLVWIQKNVTDQPWLVEAAATVIHYFTQTEVAA